SESANTRSAIRSAEILRRPARRRGTKTRARPPSIGTNVTALRSAVIRRRVREAGVTRGWPEPGACRSSAQQEREEQDRAGQHRERVVHHVARLDPPERGGPADDGAPEAVDDPVDEAEVEGAREVSRQRQEGADDRRVVQ